MELLKNKRYCVPASRMTEEKNGALDQACFLDKDAEGLFDISKGTV